MILPARTSPSMSGYTDHVHHVFSLQAKRVHYPLHVTTSFKAIHPRKPCVGLLAACCPPDKLQLTACASKSSTSMHYPEACTALRENYNAAH